MRLQRGAEDIDWDAVYAANAHRLRRIIARRIDGWLVDDVLQETFLRAFRGSGSLDRSRPIEPWLTTIALRAASDARRGTAAADCLGTAASMPSGRSVEDEFDARERRRVVLASLGSLTDRHRKLIHQVAVEGRTQSSVARAEGVHPDAVRAAMVRARRQFVSSYARLSLY